MIEYGYINDSGYLVSEILKVKEEVYKDKNNKTRKRILSVEEQIKTLSDKGWKPVDAIDEDQMQCKEKESVHLEPYDAIDHIAYHYNKHMDLQGIKKSLSLLRANLADSDYKIVKSYECSLAGLDNPYDIYSLHIQRQAIRDKINKLEKYLLE